MGKSLKIWDFLLLVSIVSFSISINSVQGLYCYVCSSDTLEDCSTLHSTDELPFELCPSDVSSCFTRIERGITIRGCLSHRTEALCTEDSCSFCRSNKCNEQIFPEDRLSCLHCEGTTCVNQTNTIEVRYPCANYVPEDECFSIFSYDGSNAYRGCMSDYTSTNRAYCLENYAQCEQCKKRACNSDYVQFEKKLSCVKCSPDENSNCNVIDENTAETECAPTALGYTNLCYMFQKGSVSHRGCLYEAPDEIFVECDNLFSEACLTCNQTDCNRTPIINENLTLNPFHYEMVQVDGKSKYVPCDNPKCTKLSPWERSCYKCDSKINPNCTNQLNDTMIGLCDFDQEDFGCYHTITDAGVVRGCIVDLNGQVKQKCLSNDDTCKTCSDRNCNARESFSECLVTDEDQSKAWNRFESLSSPKICGNYDEQCFVQVIAKDTVVRGCLDTYALQNILPLDFLNTVENNRTYRVCSGPLCNDEVVKPMFCLSCNSTDKNCITDPHLHMYLQKRCEPLEVQQSGCYHFDNGSYVERGCIADLDANERADCESDSDNCKRCWGNQCNAKEGFLTCISSNNDTTSRLPKLCRRYTDECFVLVKNETVHRGCLSGYIDSPEPGIDIMSDRRNRDIYDSCFYKNCNSQELESEYCIVCSSESDDRNYCKYGPTTDMRQKCPLRVDRLGCYLQQGDIVKRGCVSQLDFEERNNCHAVNGTCKICNEDTCNKKRFFEICKTCSSENDENCMLKPWMSDEKTCPNYMDQCYIHVKDGIIKRNCVGDNFITSIEQCANSEHCKHCSGYKCNRNEILPEVCINCDSHVNETCKAFSNLEEKLFRQECPISVETQGCYHFIDKSDGRHIRGCVAHLSDEEKMQYNKKSDEFKICNGKECNSQSFLGRCLVCNSTENPDCATNPNPSYSKLCKSYKNMCFTRISQNNVERGCFYDLKGVSQVQCEHAKGRCEICSTTSGVGCNNITIEMDTCIECDSTKDESCRFTPQETDQRICAHIEPAAQKGCYLSIVGDHVKRGCIQDLSSSQVGECLNGSDTCKTCNNSNCNLKPNYQECYNCNSKDDPRCARGVKSAKTEVCKTYYSECMTGIDQQGYTRRGCSTNNKDMVEGFFPQSENCVEDNCNYKIFPENRLKCYQCNINENCNFMSPNATDVDLQPQPCGILSDFDQCFTYINKDNKMFRGCSSDSTQIRLECELDGENKLGTCVKCSGSGCNEQPKTKKPELSCVKCIDSEECAFGQNPSLAIPCSKDVVFGDEESCFVHKLPGSSVVKRGCTLDVNASNSNWCREENGCGKCSAKGCNTQNIRFSWCLRCESDIHGYCAKVSNSSDFIVECDHLSYSYSKRGCFTNSKGENVTRGCNIDLSEEQYENCRTDDSCKLCHDNYCNKEEINLSSKTSASILMYFFVLSITFFSPIF